MNPRNPFLPDLPARIRGVPTAAKVRAGFGAALVILAAVALAARETTSRLSDALELERHTHAVLSAIAELELNLRAVEAAHRGWVATGERSLLTEYTSAHGELRRSLSRVEALTADNAAQQQGQEQLAAALARRMAYLDSANALRGRDPDAAEEAVRAGATSPLRAEISALVTGLRSAELTLLDQRDALVETTMRRARWTNVGGIVLSALLVLLATYYINADLRARTRAETLLAENEQRLRDFLDTASDLIQSSSPDARLLYVNRAWLETLGYEEHEVIGAPTLDFVAPESREQGAENLRRLLAGESIPLELVYVRRDGRRVHVSGNSNPRAENGTVVATRTILRDVTKQREVERLKEEFVSVVSHELRTPLTSIRGALGLLAGGLLGPLPDRGQRMLDVAISNTDRLVRLINDILDVERIESGKAPMEKKRVDIATLVAQAEEVMRGMAEKAGVVLRTEAQSAELDADPDRIIQTLTNLISNAIKFSPAGAEVVIAAAAAEQHVHVQVIDSGRGIPADKIDSIFERFQQVDASDARDKGGSGLGLAIARGIVEQHEGRLWVESEFGSGTTFHITLPAARRESAPDELPVPEGAGPLLLVVDDDPDVREVLSTMLRQRGYRVVCATDGAHAVGKAVETQPAAILLDLMMPVVDGWRTLELLKEDSRTRDVPVIIVSGIADADGHAHVRKPVAENELLTEVERAIGRWGAGADVLVIEDDPDLARVLLEFFRRAGLAPVHAPDGRTALRLVQTLEPALLVLDLMLPDTDGFAVADWLRRHEELRHVPIIVYTARDLNEQDRARLGVHPERLFTKSRMAPDRLADRVAGIIGSITYDRVSREADEEDTADRG